MMWTLGNKSKIQGHSVDFKQVTRHYHKILAIIRSSKTSDHIHVCRRIINNFEDFCSKTDVPKETSILLASFLRNTLEYKIKKY